MVAKLPRLATTSVPTNLSVGGSTDCSEIYVGSFDLLYLGIRTQLTITPLVERYADVGMVGFVAWVRMDVQVGRPGAFAVLTGVRP